MTADEPAPPRNKWVPRLRLLAIVALFAGGYAVARATGLLDELDADAIRESVARAGPWGVLLYIAIFAGGELLHVPGMAFVAAAILLWGQAAGFGIALVASVISVCVSFVVVRTIGGKPLGNVDRPLMRKMLDRLHARPIVTIALLRSIFWMSPPLNYALALTNIRFRDYLIGSAVGLVVPVLLATLLFDLLIG